MKKSSNTPISPQEKVEKQRATLHIPTARVPRMARKNEIFSARIASARRFCFSSVSASSPISVKKPFSSFLSCQSSGSVRRRTVTGTSSSGGRSISGSPHSSAPFFRKPTLSQKRLRRALPQFSSAYRAPFSFAQSRSAAAHCLPLPPRNSGNTQNSMRKHLPSSAGKITGIASPISCPSRLKNSQLQRFSARSWILWICSRYSPPRKYSLSGSSGSGKMSRLK